MRLSLISVGPPYRGGISDLSALIYEELSKDHQVQFINFKRQYPSILFPGKTEYKIGDRASDFPSKRIIDSINPLTWLQAVKQIRDFDSEWAIFRYWNPFFAPLIGYIARKLRKKSIKVAILIDNLVPHEESFLDSWMARRILSRADHVITMSKSVSEDVQTHRPGMRTSTLFHPLYEIYHSSHSKAEARAKLHLPDHPIVLYFGLIRPYKGLDIMIKALGCIKHEFDDYTALILGEAYEDSQKYVDLIKSEGISSYTIFRNEFISDSELPLYFSAADVLVLPYRTATQSGIVGIALQMDRPVIATKVGGLGEYIQEGETGYLVEPENPEAMGQAILSFFLQGDSDRMTENIKATKSQYSTQSFCLQLIQDLQNA
ncbi:MAG: glycosyltransferase [Candidatus Marinimicrobia bacterium]|nr:glycosyltransferase [Candidatus Neomarinimicrobiota bacterium]MBT4362141.1 glycosyltransferase [Candidatus Neomarinimicrobiota bacterium]MBT4713664.1 glycosyltransferase [Candidatus Neomarinimicrobiota bacterium]MBT4945196.1 glycosyltransferase [Candidatus Neomarinimicrobiota bacterium]MBT5268806.1 glycosyltransferase [Candidatus Neomarinimicrobiota bacterium]